jgi:HNH endonuclease
MSNELIKSDDLRQLTEKQRRNFFKYVIKMEGCWEWIGAISRGYGKFKVGTRKVRAHRLAYELFVGEIPEGMCVCHSCDNTRCVNPNHLFLGTEQTNATDKVVKGRAGTNKLTKEQVLKIRERHVFCNETITALAKEYGVDYVTVWYVIKRKTWRHI